MLLLLLATLWPASAHAMRWPASAHVTATAAAAASAPRPQPNPSTPPTQPLPRVQVMSTHLSSAVSVRVTLRVDVKEHDGETWTVHCFVSSLAAAGACSIHLGLPPRPAT